jgi:LysR family glycine cleavage system transcriptional activator
MKLVQRYPALRNASIKSLQAFESAYLHKNFAVAAKELSVTASAISHAILSLESVLGVQLFDRGKRGATPTDAGMRLYAAIRRAFSDVDLEMQIIKDKTAKRQLVTLQISPSFASIWILPRLLDFTRQNPETDLRLWAIHEPADFSNNGLDIAIVYGQPPMSPAIHTEKLMPAESYVPLCSPVLAGHEGTGLEQISDMYLIHCDVTSVSWKSWASRYLPEGENMDRGIHFDRSYMSLSAAINNGGVCLDSTLLAYEYLQKNQLVMPFGNKSIPQCAHHLCVPKAKIDLDKVQLVLSWIKSWLPR